MLNVASIFSSNVIFYFRGKKFDFRLKSTYFIKQFYLSKKKTNNAADSIESKNKTATNAKKWYKK